MAVLCWATQFLLRGREGGLGLEQDLTGLSHTRASLGVDPRKSYGRTVVMKTAVIISLAWKMMHIRRVLLPRQASLALRGGSLRKPLQTAMQLTRPFTRSSSIKVAPLPV
eukprot:Rmarinus@m.11164